VALTREAWFVDRFSASLEQPHELGMQKAYRDSIGFALNYAVGQFTTALTYYGGLRLIEGGHVSFQDLYVTLMVALVTAQSVGRSATFTSSLDKGKIGAIKTFELLERQTKIDPDKDGFVPDEFDPSFEFKDIAFTYPARPDQVTYIYFLTCFRFAILLTPFFFSFLFCFL
jgi:ABC-type bacteriocin/lantibiotic exporter with double-glycine peptidase domain